MELIFLGTGTSQGVPMIAQGGGEGCDLSDRRNWRTRTSVHIRMGGVAFQIDAAPEFRLQCIENRIEWIDYFFLTHGHADHILGMDDLRRFIDLRAGDALPVYSTPAGLQRVRDIYPYAIRPKPVCKGYPAFELAEMPPRLETPGGTVFSCLLPHGSVDVLGFVFVERGTGKRLAYYTDCKFLPEPAVELARGADLVVLDALRPHEHPTHMNVTDALDAAEMLGAAQTYFIHMTYMIDQEQDGARLPQGVKFAYDGLRIEL